jgi:hypothetical protein
MFIVTSRAVGKPGGRFHVLAKRDVMWEYMRRPQVASAAFLGQSEISPRFLLTGFFFFLGLCQTASCSDR